MCVVEESGKLGKIRVWLVGKRRRKFLVLRWFLLSRWPFPKPKISIVVFVFLNRLFQIRNGVFYWYRDSLLLIWVLIVSRFELVVVLTMKGFRGSVLSFDLNKLLEGQSTIKAWQGKIEIVNSKFERWRGR